MSSEAITGRDSLWTYYKLHKRNKIPIVLIHGVGLDHQMWEYQIYSFENTILTYDILGHGKTPLEKENITFDDEIVIAIGGASSGRAHARTGDRYQDMKEMGLDPK